MPISTKDFWRLLVESRLVSAADCQKLYERSGAKVTAENDQPRAVAEWLVGKRVLTRYQGKVLLSGRAGPFVYGPYQLRDRLTSGRLSGCFKAVHTPTRHPVLLWFFSGPVLQDPQAYDMAARQIALACRTVHPCLSQTCQLLDLGKYKFAVLEDLVGATAEEALANRGRMRPAEACRVMRHVALGVGAMHAHGAAHGDIRPHNIWIDAQGHARLLQLPLSRLPHRPPSSPVDPVLTDDERSNVADYAAPELAFAGHAPDALSDIYAIGCTLYQLLSGTPPFAGGDARAKMQRHAAEAIKPLEPLGVPAQLAKVVAYAMAKDHKLRYQSAAQLADALAYFVDPAEVGLMPQPAPTYATFEAWRAAAAQTVLPHAAVAEPHAPVRVVSPQPPQTRSAAESGGGGQSVFVATSATTPHAPFVQSEPHGSAVPAAALVAAPHSTHTQPANLVETNGFGELTFVTTTPEMTSATALIRQRRRRARNNALFLLGFIAALGIGAGVGYVVYDRKNGPGTASHSDNSDSGTASGESDGSGESSPDTQVSSTAASRDTKNESTKAAAVTVIPDDGQTLWASPTAGAPISWAYLPARAEIVMALRPADLLHHPEAEKLLTALGPNGESARSAAEEAIGMKLDEIEQIIVAWTKGTDGWTTTYVVRPATTTTPEILAAKWQAFQAKEQGAEKYFVSGQRAYFAPTAEEGKLFVVTSLHELPDILAAGRDAAPLMRDMLKLVKTSDAQRTCSLLFSKDALLRDAKPLLAHAGLDDVAAWLLREDCKAAAISLHLDENCYLEARLVGNAQSTTASDLTKSVQDRMKRLAIDVEDYVSRVGLDPYGGKVLIRLGSMTRFVQQQLRFGAENDQVVINCYLPAVAAHNLALAADLAAVRPIGEATTSLPRAATPTIDSPSSVSDKLKKKISFVQTGDTLEKALQTVSAEIDVPIEILGNDLATEGITRNNRFDVDAKDQPADHIIRAILLKANPDGKLVYVIKPKGAGGAETLFVTTRTAAARRGDSLPPEFAAPADTKKAKTAKTAKTK